MLIRFNNGQTLQLMPVFTQGGGTHTHNRGAGKVSIDQVVERPKHKYGRVIRIDRDVWNAMVERAESYDNPNDVLRRVFNLPAKHKRAAFGKGKL